MIVYLCVNELTNHLISSYMGDVKHLLVEISEYSYIILTPPPCFYTKYRLKKNHHFL